MQQQFFEHTDLYPNGAAAAAWPLPALHLPCAHPRHAANSSALPNLT